MRPPAPERVQGATDSEGDSLYSKVVDLTLDLDSPSSPPIPLSSQRALIDWYGNEYPPSQYYEGSFSPASSSENTAPYSKPSSSTETAQRNIYVGTLDELAETMRLPEA